MNYWKITTWLLLLVLACVFMLGAYHRDDFNPRTVEAQEFVLKDSSGRTRARLGMKNDKPQIEFYDETGRAVAMLPDRGFKELQAR